MNRDIEFEPFRGFYQNSITGTNLTPEAGSLTAYPTSISGTTL